MKIVTLEAQNIMKLKAIRITPETDQPLVIIGGMNEAGKTSVLQSIIMALDGKAIVEQPIRRGAKKGEVKIDLGDIQVIKKFLPSGPTLEIKGKTKGKSPQALLDSLRSKFIDPVELSRMKPDKLQTLLKDLVGLDFTKEDKEYQETYDSRRDINRDIKELKPQVDAIPLEAVPEVEVSMEELTDQLAEKLKVNQDNNKKRSSLDILRETNKSIQAQGKALNEQIEKLQVQKKELLEKYQTSKTTEAILQGEVDDLKDLLLEDIYNRIDNLQATNKKIAAQTTRKQLSRKLEALEEKSLGYSNRLLEIAETKQQKLQEAKFPIEGLSFSETGVTYKDFPFEQCSGEEKLRIGTAIGMAMSPELRVLIIKDASLLDRNNKVLMAQMAEENNFQIWMEVVTDNESEATVIIEDGEVKGQKIETKEEIGETKPGIDETNDEF